MGLNSEQEVKIPHMIVSNKAKLIDDNFFMTILWYVRLLLVKVASVVNLVDWNWEVDFVFGKVGALVV